MQPEPQCDETEAGTLRFQLVCSKTRGQLLSLDKCRNSDIIGLWRLSGCGPVPGSWDDFYRETIAYFQYLAETHRFQPWQRPAFNVTLRVTPPVLSSGWVKFELLQNSSPYRWIAEGDWHVLKLCGGALDGVFGVGVRPAVFWLRIEPVELPESEGKCASST